MKLNEQPQFKTILSVLSYTEEQAKDFLKRQQELNKFISLKIIEKYKEAVQTGKSLDEVADALIVDCQKESLRLLSKEECSMMHVSLGLQVQLQSLMQMMQEARTDQTLN